ncbi:DUF1616 domain-containing protein [Methanobacterium oryzae]|uniref:DUF1616 domain-containing protein n=1 Tax=Methanobacterium oryzae TaxID=69540 RepID=UPI003D2024A5
MAKLNFDRTLSAILIVIIIIALIATIYIVLSPSQSEKFTEFYILGENGKAGDYPTNLTLNQEGDVTVGIVNHEGKNTTYQLVIKFNQIILKNETISLLNNEKKEIPFTFIATQSGNDQKLEFLLYKLPNKTDVYRSLHLIVDVT